MMKKTILLVLAALLLPAPIEAQTKVGSWMLQKEPGTPDAMYMAFPLTTVICQRDDDGGYYVRQIWRDGSVGEKDLVERSHPAGRRFDIVGNAFGEFYLLRENGQLEYRDSEGVVYRNTPGRTGDCS